MSAEGVIGDEIEGFFRKVFSAALGSIPDTNNDGGVNVLFCSEGFHSAMGIPGDADEGGGGVEEVLAVVHVDDGEVLCGGLVVRGGEVDLDRAWGDEARRERGECFDHDDVMHRRCGEGAEDE